MEPSFELEVDLVSNYWDLYAYHCTGSNLQILRILSKHFAHRNEVAKDK